MLCFVRNRFELLNAIERVQNGISREDLADCYNDANRHISDMITGGEIIAVKNKDSKIQILYPRGRPFLVKLPGTVACHPHHSYIITSEDLRGDIRRGEAIRLERKWFRVGSAVRATATDQPERARAPLSVTLSDDLSSKNVYIDEYSNNQLPLDASPGIQYSGDAYRHGCTTDVTAMWRETVVEMRPVADEKSLHDQLLKLRLISRPGNVAASKYDYQKAEAINNKSRKRVRRASAKITNTHLMGTELGDLLASTQYDVP